MKLGDLITQVDERNSDDSTTELLGVAIEKRFIPSVANVIGTDLSKYKLVSKDRFACNPMHVGRDEKLPIARYDADDAAIVSPAYSHSTLPQKGRFHATSNSGSIAQSSIGVAGLRLMRACAVAFRGMPCAASRLTCPPWKSRAQ